MSHTRFVFGLLTLVLIGELHASDWSRFRGPNGTGVSPDSGLPAEMDRNKNVIWSTKIPRGNSSPIISQGRIVFTGHEGDDRMVLCYDAATGAVRWRKTVRRKHAEEFHPQNGPTTPTPAADGKNIYVFFPDVGLVAYSLEGKELWQSPMGPFSSVQGLAASPLHVHGRIVVFIDTPEDAYLVAFDARTGKEIWKTKRATGVLGSYATPTLNSSGQNPQEIIVAGAIEMTGYNSETGERVWWARVTEFPTAPPFAQGDSVYTVEPAGVSWPSFAEVQKLFDKNKDSKVELSEAKSDTGWALSLRGIDKNVGNNDNVVTADEYAKLLGAAKTGGLSRIRLGGKGDVTYSHVVWRNTKGMPDLAGALFYENVLYTIRSGIFASYDPETGKMLRQERLRNAPGDYYASPVAADRKIYLVNMKGNITILKAGADWRVLSTGDLGQQVIATPAIADGRIYVRTENTLYCFSITKTVLKKGR